MDPFGSSRNYPLLAVLAQRIDSLVGCLLRHVQQESVPVQNTFRQALLPMHRALTDFLFAPSHSARQSFQLRGATNSFSTLPSMPHYLNQPTLSTVDRFPPYLGSITPPEDITPPGGTPPQSNWSSTPLGFTSTPLRQPTVRPQREPFALINQLLTVIRTSNECNLSNVTEPYANDPVFRERVLHELEELRSYLVAQPDSTSSVAGQAVRALLDRVEQAEVTLTMLINNLEHLQNH
uniref:Uncharacterized protein n=1 Tax=Anopheles christyi TaxID=43041 RepID=A0A182KBL5_9DIPT